MQSGEQTFFDKELQLVQCVPAVITHPKTCKKRRRVIPGLLWAAWSSVWVLPLNLELHHRLRKKWNEWLPQVLLLVCPLRYGELYGGLAQTQEQNHQF